MVGTCDMDESEVEHKDGHNPVIDAGTRGNVGIHEHAFDIASIDFDDKVSYADEVESECTECMIEAVKLELGL
jgi:hypothetical protein